MLHSSLLTRVSADGIIWYENARRIARAIFAASLCVLLVACAFRFMPRLNDALSGQPQYLHRIAEQMARFFSEKTNHEFPVLVQQREDGDCDHIRNLPSHGDDFYYVFSFSEKEKSLCFITYQPTPSQVNSGSSQWIGAHTDVMFGPQLTKEIAVEPIGHFSLKFPDSYLTLLHWRTRIDSARLAHAGSAELRRSIPESMPYTSVDISIQLPKLREAVARRHNTLNAALLFLIVLSSSLLAIAAFTDWRLYRMLAQHCAKYDRRLEIPEFLFGNLYLIVGTAERSYRHRQEEVAKIRRQETLLRETTEQVRSRLISLLESIGDNVEKQRITSIIESGDLARMKRVMQEIEPQVDQFTPEERILSLVDSVEPFSTLEELDTLRTETLKILQKSGFRLARAFAVHAHDEFRRRSKIPAAEEAKAVLEPNRESGRQDRK